MANVRCVSVPRWCQSVMNEDVGAVKDSLENLNTQKSTSRRTLTGILLKNSKTCAGSSQYNKQVKKHDCECSLSPMIFIGNQMENS